MDLDFLYKRFWQNQPYRQFDKNLLNNNDLTYVGQTIEKLALWVEEMTSRWFTWHMGTVADDQVIGLYHGYFVELQQKVEKVLVNLHPSIKELLKADIRVFQSKVQDTDWEKISLIELKIKFDEIIDCLEIFVHWLALVEKDIQK